MEINKMNFKHPITGEKLNDVNELANVFHDEIIEPFEEKTQLKVNGWSEDGVTVYCSEWSSFRFPLWLVLKILNDWK
jgi:hypothetical protein